MAETARPTAPRQALIGQEQLDLSGKQLAALPEHVGTPGRTCAACSSTIISWPRCPSRWAALAQLRWLAADGNALTDLPAAIGQLSRSRAAGSSGAIALAVVPDVLRQLAQLRDLRLGKNLLADVPDWLWQLTNSRDAGPLREPPIVPTGWFGRR